MKKEDLSEALDGLDEKYVDEASAYAAAHAPRKQEGKVRALTLAEGRQKRIRWGALAACLALTLAVGAVGIGLAEHGTYASAVSFFEENGLSAEGLSRAEVKAVYRDITTARFSYGKTAEVLRQTAAGWEIAQKEPTPEELAAVWDKNVWTRRQPGKGIGYRIDHTEKKDEASGLDVLEKSVVTCCKDGEPLWTAEFPSFYAEDAAYTADGTAVWGQIENVYSFDMISQFYRVDEQGNILWGRRPRHGFESELISAVLDNGDGTWAVISRGDFKYLCLSRYDMNGNELSFTKTEIGNLGIWNAARLGDGYIVQAGNTMTGDTALLYKLDRDGGVTDSFTYEGDDCDYYIVDMIGFGGQVYLSAYAVPKQTDAGDRHEIADILAYIFSEEKVWEISSEELTSLLRENYTAVLLLCDPAGGTPRTFYSVKGSLGGKLRVNEEGNLEWDAESITSSFFSPATSAFSVGGTCKVFRYTFGETGALLSQTDTGETTAYHR